ncbi:MAG: cysteine desulfurase family protein [Bacteroidota bacterium]
MQTTRIYLDNAASKPMDPEVLEVMRPYLLEAFGNPSSTHGHGRALRNAIEESRRTIAGCLHAQPAEIFFTSGGTEADNLAIRGAVEAYDIKHVISSPVEHHAVTHTIEELEKAGKISVSWLSVDQYGRPDLNQLDQLLATSPRSLVSLMHVNNELGTISDIRHIGEMCHQYDALFHSDTVQSMGALPLPMDELKVDFATAAAHKFYGPKGVGFLYVRKGLHLPAQITGGSQERKLRAGTENVAFIVGMAHALQKCTTMLDKKQAHMLHLKQLLMQRLEAEVPGIAYNGPTDVEEAFCGVLNVALPCQGEDAMLLFNLDLAGISASGGSACSSGALIGSHVLRAIGANKNGLLNSIRFSFGMQNTPEEIEIVVAKLKEIIPVRVEA